MDCSLGRCFLFENNSLFPKMCKIHFLFKLNYYFFFEMFKTILYILELFENALLIKSGLGTISLLIWAFMSRLYITQSPRSHYRIDPKQLLFIRVLSLIKKFVIKIHQHNKNADYKGYAMESILSPSRSDHYLYFLAYFFRRFLCVTQCREEKILLLPFQVLWLVQ